MPPKRCPARAGDPLGARLGPSKAQQPGPRNDVGPSWGPVRSPGGSQASPCPVLVLTVLVPWHPWQSPFPWEDPVLTQLGHLASACRTPWTRPESARRRAVPVSSLTKHSPPVSPVNLPGGRCLFRQAHTPPGQLALQPGFEPAVPEPQIHGGSMGDRSPPMRKPGPFSHAAS